MTPCPASTHPPCLSTGKEGGGIYRPLVATIARIGPGRTRGSGCWIWPCGIGQGASVGIRQRCGERARHLESFDLGCLPRSTQVVHRSTSESWRKRDQQDSIHSTRQASALIRNTRPGWRRCCRCCCGSRSRPGGPQRCGQGAALRSAAWPKPCDLWRRFVHLYALVSPERLLKRW